jgi:hypothetical protein
MVDGCGGRTTAVVGRCLSSVTACNPPSEEDRQAHSSLVTVSTEARGGLGVGRGSGAHGCMSWTLTHTMF